MRQETIQSEVQGVRIRSQQSDISQLTAGEHLQILFSSRLIHAFEQELIDLQKKRLLWGALHPSFGMEVSASAALHALGGHSRINSTHRGHHHVIAKGLFTYLDEQWNPLDSDSQGERYTAFTRFLQQTCAEILGLTDGFCSGRGGSMHLYDASVGIHGTNAIVGGALPAAVGLAFGVRYQKSQEIVMSFFGDGASNQGTFHESCNLASIYRLPVIFYLENNQYAVGTKSQQVCAGEVLALRALGYGMQVFQVSADDPLAVHHAVTEAKRTILSGGPPALIEAVGYRPIHHDSPLPGSAYGYRTREEEAHWAQQSGYERYPELLLSANVVTVEQLTQLDRSIEELIGAVFTPYVGEKRDEIAVSLWPECPPESRVCFAQGSADVFGRDLTPQMRSDGSELASLPFVDESWIRDHSTQSVTYVQSIAAVTDFWLQKDSAVHIWGEDVANFNQGPYGATKRLMHRYPDRVLNMPISESAFVGMALGAAMVGVKPIVEIMFPDFVLVAADQLFNQIAKARYMYGGSVDVPIVVRTRIATGTGMGPQHSMDPAMLFSLFPGWRIVAPADAAHYVGLFNTAMASKDPVLILEHHTLYQEKMHIPESLDYAIPFGTARTVREGSDVTCVTYGGMVKKLSEAAEALSGRLSLEVIDLCSLDLPSIDYETIAASVGKTKNVVFFEESPLSQSLGRQVLFNLGSASEVVLQRKAQVVTSVDVPMPVSKPLEEQSILSAQEIIRYFTECWRSL